MTDRYLSYRKNLEARSAMAVALVLATSLISQACVSPDSGDCRTEPALAGDYSDGRAAAETAMSQDYSRGEAEGLALTFEDGRREGYDQGCRDAYDNGVADGRGDVANLDRGYTEGYGAYVNDAATCSQGDQAGYGDGFPVGEGHGQYRGYIFGYEGSGYYDHGLSHGVLYGSDTCSGFSGPSPADRDACYNLGYSDTYRGGEYARGKAAGVTANQEYKSGKSAGQVEGLADSANCYNPGLVVGQRAAYDDGYSLGKENALVDTYEACYWAGYGECTLVTEVDYFDSSRLTDVCAVASDGQTPVGATGGVLDGFVYGFDDPAVGYGSIAWEDEQYQLGFIDGSGGIADAYMDGFDDGVCASGCAESFFSREFCSFAAFKRAGGTGTQGVRATHTVLLADGGKAVRGGSHFGRKQPWAVRANGVVLDGYRKSLSSTLPAALRAGFEKRLSAAEARALTTTRDGQPRVLPNRQ